MTESETAYLFGFGSEGRRRYPLVERYVRKSDGLVAFGMAACGDSAGFSYATGGTVEHDTNRTTRMDDEFSCCYSLQKDALARGRVMSRRESRRCSTRKSVITELST
jgi:hypothetical protein